MDFLNLLMAVHHHLGVDIPDITLERAGDVSQDQTWNKQKLMSPGSGCVHVCYTSR
jgi:hypothetical protein